MMDSVIFKSSNGKAERKNGQLFVSVQRGFIHEIATELERVQAELAAMRNRTVNSRSVGRWTDQSRTEKAYHREGCVEASLGTIRFHIACRSGHGFL